MSSSTHSQEAVAVQQDLIQKKRILVVDDHRNIRITLRMTLEQEGGDVEEAATFAEAISKLSDGVTYDCMLFDIRLPDGNGLDLLKLMAEKQVAGRVIMISGEGTINEAFKATQFGAFDYIEKPFTPERIIVSVSRCIGFNSIKKDVSDLLSQLQRGIELLGKSPAIMQLHQIISRVAPTSGRVLITGESGTGKELVARAIHQKSQRKDKALIKVNCAAIPHSLIESELFGHEKGAFTGAIKSRKGVFERADQGTLFLDEIGELDLDVQAKLLRVLQSGELTPVGSERTIHVDVRLIAATNRDLAEMVALGKFREDLYYRLNVVTIHVAPLRERGQDVVMLANTFLAQACEEHSLGERSFSDEALNQFQNYRWPGNVRELKNTVERLAILSESPIIDRLPEADLLPHSKQSETPITPLMTSKGVPKDFEFFCRAIPWHDFHETAGREYIRYMLQLASGNVSEAARLMCLERAYLHRLMKKLGVHRSTSHEL